MKATEIEVVLIIGIQQSPGVGVGLEKIQRGTCQQKGRAISDTTSSLETLIQLLKRDNRHILVKWKKSCSLAVKKSPLHGLGCFATIRLLKGSRIAEYSGERITRKEANRRMRSSNGERISELDTDCYIDGNVNGDLTQYINHCCDPNSDALVKDGALIIFALREITPGEEITVDYLNSFDHDQSVCQCRTPSCRQTNTQ